MNEFIITYLDDSSHIREADRIVRGEGVYLLEEISEDAMSDERKVPLNYAVTFIVPIANVKSIDVIKS